MPRKNIRIAALSAGAPHYAAGNPGIEANFARLMELAGESIAARPDIILFPEFAMTGWPYPPSAAVRACGEPVPGDGPFYARYAELAQKSGAVVCGWLVERTGETTYHNTSALIGSDGKHLGTYRKTHPTMGEEGQWGMAPGGEIPVFDLGFAKVGIAICWDMDFPEVCRAHLLRGADLVLHPTVADDRRDICPVRSKENALPMVISIFQGGSYAVDGYGETIADLDTGNGGFLVCDVDLGEPATMPRYGYTADRRQRFLTRRRPETYAVLTDPSAVPPWGTGLQKDDGTAVSREEIDSRFPWLCH